jgi:uncharacterized membrane protein
MTDLRDSVSATTADELLRHFHDARRREDQWRIPQLLLALVTPILALIAAVLDMANLGNAFVALALSIVTGVAAALIAVEGWRWHRIALSRVNQFRTEHPNEAGLLLKDPI